MDTPILIFGTKEKGQAALEIFQNNGIIVYGLLTEEETPQEGKTYGHVSVLGHTKDRTYLDLLGDKCHPFVAVEGIKASQEIITQLGAEEKLHPLNAIHSATNLDKEARLGAGNIIHVGSSVGAEAMIHHHCALMGHNMVGYGATLHDFVYLGIGAIVNPGVTIHEEAYIGSGAILKANITIGAKAYIAPGAVVLEDVPEGTVVAGNPASMVEQVKRQPKNHE